MWKIKFKNGDVREFESLSDQDLRNADLYGVDLSFVDLRFANLSGADLRNVDLRRANLSGVNLRNVDLYGADLRGVNLRGANHSMEVLKSISGLTWDIALKDDLVRVGCQEHKLEEWLGFEEKDIENMDKKALEFYPSLLMILKTAYKDSKYYDLFKTYRTVRSWK
jgi:hypothetical protein